jgi:hypothetical protein
MVADAEANFRKQLKYTDRMDGRKVCLKAVMIGRDGKSCWGGEYQCSVCGQRFRPDPADAARLTREFEVHAAREHASEAQ